MDAAAKQMIDVVIVAPVETPAVAVAAIRKSTVAPLRPASNQQLAYIRVLTQRKGWNIRGALDTLATPVPTLHDMSIKQASELITTLKAA